MDHDWIKAPFGVDERLCARCRWTERELAGLGRFDCRPDKVDVRTPAAWRDVLGSLAGLGVFDLASAAAIALFVGLIFVLALAGGGP